MDGNDSYPMCEEGATNVTGIITSYGKHLPLFWCFASACIMIAITAIIGNGMVIYVSHQTRNNTGRLRHLDGVVKSLAVTDFLFGLVGTPIVIITYYMGKLRTLGWVSFITNIYCPH